MEFHTERKGLVIYKCMGTLYVHIPYDCFFSFKKKKKKNELTEKSGGLWKYKPDHMLQKSVHRAVKENVF